MVLAHWVNVITEPQVDIDVYEVMKLFSWGNHTCNYILKGAVSILFGPNYIELQWKLHW